MYVRTYVSTTVLMYIRSYIHIQNNDTHGCTIHKKRVRDMCVQQEESSRGAGVQCTAAVHVDDLIITSVDRRMIRT